jgi:hypothetical protein
MKKLSRIIFGALLTLLGVGIIIFAVMIWPRPFQLVMVMVGFIPVSALGAAIIFAGVNIICGMSIKEALEYLELMWHQ